MIAASFVTPTYCFSLGHPSQRAKVRRVQSLSLTQIQIYVWGMQVRSDRNIMTPKIILYEQFFRVNWKHTWFTDWILSTHFLRPRRKLMMMMERCMRILMNDGETGTLLPPHPKPHFTSCLTRCLFGHDSYCALYVWYEWILFMFMPK